MSNDFAMHPDVDNERDWLRLVLPRLCSGDWNIAECGSHKIIRRVGGDFIVSEETMAAIARFVHETK